MPLRATAEFAWINVNETRIETGSFGPVEAPAKHYWGAQTQRSLVHFAIARKPCRWRSQGDFERNVNRPVIAFALRESLVEELAAKRKRIDELVRQSLMLVACAKDRLTTMRRGSPRPRILGPRILRAS
jgi:fumarate hydratase class II